MALLCAAYQGKLPMCQWLLEHGGADITDRSTRGGMVWDLLPAKELARYCPRVPHLDSLLRVMVLKGDPPAGYVRRVRG
jgi:hypothetical protein